MMSVMYGALSGGAASVVRGVVVGTAGLPSQPQNIKPAAIRSPASANVGNHRRLILMNLFRKTA